MQIFDNRPIDKKDFELIVKGLQKYGLLKKKYLSFFEKMWKAKKEELSREFPLVSTILRYGARKNPFLERLNDLLKFHEKINTKGLNKIIKESQNKRAFYHSFSQLELAKFFINEGFEVELGSDLCLKKEKWEIYVEIKTFNESDYLDLSFKPLVNINSEYWLEIKINIFTNAQVNKLEEEVEKRLKNSKKFDLTKPLELKMGRDLPVFAKVKFHKKDKFHGYKKTGLVLGTTEVSVVDHLLNKKRIEEILFKATEQLNQICSSHPKFVLFDLINSVQDLKTLKDADTFKRVVYGERVSIANLVISATPRKKDALSKKQQDAFVKKLVDKTIKKENLLELNELCDVKEFKEVCRRFLKYEMGKSNTALTYLKDKGLYFNKKEYSSLNGIIVRGQKTIAMFPNPFVEKKILIDEKTLKKLFSF